MAKNQNTTESAIEQPAPALLADRKPNQKNGLFLALMQPTAPLANFWQTTSQEAAQIGAAEIASRMVSKGKTSRDVAEIFAILGTGNASAMRQYVRENFTSPSGAAAKAIVVDLSSLGL